MTEALNLSTPSWDAYCHPSLAYDDGLLPPGRCGKWMHVFIESDRPRIRDVCRAAVEEGIVLEAKMSTPYQMHLHGGDTGVACFYIDGTDAQQHRRLIGFMLDCGLFPYGADGRLEDVPFKFDWQTCAGLYDDDFIPEITLSHYVDLATGRML